MLISTIKKEQYVITIFHVEQVIAINKFKN